MQASEIQWRNFLKKKSLSASANEGIWSFTTGLIFFSPSEMFLFKAPAKKGAI